VDDRRGAADPEAFEALRQSFDLVSTLAAARTSDALSSSQISARLTLSTRSTQSWFAPN
jgi:hypothetical protein